MASQLTQTEVLDALRAVEDPDLHKDIVELNFVKDIQIDDTSVAFKVELTTPACPVKELLRSQAIAAVEAIAGGRSVTVEMTSSVTATQSLPDQQSIAGVKNVIGVGSGKGGVGKSTVSVNIALGLAASGAKVGLMDGDIYGPNVPMMLGISGKPTATDDEKIVPMEGYGIKVISMGMLMEADKAVVWRGPMLHSVVRQFLYEVVWGELDYLIVDLPPGTGDVQLSLAQAVPITGAIVVTTPQDVSLADARKAISMFRTTNIPLLGMVENMSGFVCPHCSETTEIFGFGGGEATAKELNIPFLGRVPLDPSVRVGGDEGKPTLATQVDGPTADAFNEILKNVAAQISIRNYSGAPAPSAT